MVAVAEGEVVAVVVVREYEEKKDCAAVEEMENRCEVGPSGKLSLYTDLLGDPICRVRNSPAYLMLVTISTATITITSISSIRAFLIIPPSRWPSWSLSAAARTRSAVRSSAPLGAASKPSLAALNSPETPTTNPSPSTLNSPTS